MQLKTVLSAGLMLGVVATSVVPETASAQRYYRHHRYARCVHNKGAQGAVTGAVVGGATVGLLSHSVAGGLLGAGVGAVAGNALGRRHGYHRC